MNLTRSMGGVGTDIRLRKRVSVQAETVIRKPGCSQLYLRASMGSELENENDLRDDLTWCGLYGRLLHRTEIDTTVNLNPIVAYRSHRE